MLYTNREGKQHYFIVNLLDFLACSLFFFFFPIVCLFFMFESALHDSMIRRAGIRREVRLKELESFIKKSYAVFVVDPRI